jgi:uncharacterized tellurite resistance protein B-like protein
MKLLHLEADQIYHVFCLALCMALTDGRVTDAEGEILTRIGFGLGLSPEDISALGQNAKQAIAETSRADVIAYSAASLKHSLEPEQLQGIKQILQFVAASDNNVADDEQALLSVLNDVWA